MTNETNETISPTPSPSLQGLEEMADIIGADLIECETPNGAHWTTDQTLARELGWMPTGRRVPFASAETTTPSPSLLQWFEQQADIARQGIDRHDPGSREQMAYVVRLKVYLEVAAKVRAVAGAATDGLREKCPSWAHHSMCRFVLENSPECDYDCRSQSLCITEYCERCYAQLWMEQYSPVSLASAKTVDTQPEASP